MDSAEFKIAISAGELSGDEHGAQLVAALRKLSPAAEVRGMGGRYIRAAGAEIVINSEESGSVMGFQELVPALRKILRSFNTMKALLQEWRPHLLVLVDYPDFNLRLARYAKSLGIAVFYYIPPQLWAWRAGRVKVIAEVVDQAAVIFPFEEEFFARHNFNRAVFVGHPFIDDFKASLMPDQEKRAFLEGAGLDPSAPILAVFPGSRGSEIRRHLPQILAALQVLRQRHPAVQPVIVQAPGVSGMLREFETREGAPWAGINLLKNSSRQLLQCATAGLLKSGTSNLQAAVAGLPFAMFYAAPKLSELIARTFVKVRQFSIVNNIRPDTVAELLQQDVNPQRLADTAEMLLFDEAHRRALQHSLREVSEKLTFAGDAQRFPGCSTASERAALLALQLIPDRL